MRINRLKSKRRVVMISIPGRDLDASVACVWYVLGCFFFFVSHKHYSNRVLAEGLRKFIGRNSNCKQNRKVIVGGAENPPNCDEQ